MFDIFLSFLDWTSCIHANPKCLLLELLLRRPQAAPQGAAGGDGTALFGIHPRGAGAGGPGRPGLVRTRTARTI